LIGECLSPTLEVFQLYCGMAFLDTDNIILRDQKRKMSKSPIIFSISVS
jgi:hypothetical protein